MQRHSFDAMGTWVECFVDSPATPALTGALEAVEDEFARLEAMLSRFRPESELSRLNRERSIEASEELRELTTLALEARRQTGGRFDPTLHDAVVAAGYDRTFAELADDGADKPPAAGGGEVTVSGNRIELGSDASLDLGGIAKGYAADRCVPMLAAHGPALVNAGGDLAISGPRAFGRRWPVAVDLPSGLLTVELAGGGLATSGRDRRRWLRNGEERHHLIDPRTLRPAEGGPRSVTVAAPTATAAEILAKALFLAEDAEREAKLAGMAAVIVPDDGQPRLVGIMG
jgi:thiamine biosynthesis lipoprotein